MLGQGRVGLLVRGGSAGAELALLSSIQFCLPEETKWLLSPKQLDVVNLLQRCPNTEPPTGEARMAWCRVKIPPAAHSLARPPASSHPNKQSGCADVPPGRASSPATATGRSPFPCPIHAPHGTLQHTCSRTVGSMADGRGMRPLMPAISLLKALPLESGSPHLSLFQRQIDKLWEKILGTSLKESVNGVRARLGSSPMLISMT